MCHLKTHTRKQKKAFFDEKVALEPWGVTSTLTSDPKEMFYF